MGNRIKMKAIKEQQKFDHLMAIGFDLEHEHLAAQEALKVEEKNLFKKSYLMLSAFCRETKGSSWFTTLITCTILLASAIAGAQVDRRLKDDPGAQYSLYV